MLDVHHGRTQVTQSALFMGWITKIAVLQWHARGHPATDQEGLCLSLNINEPDCMCSSRRVLNRSRHSQAYLPHNAHKQ